MTRFLKRYYTMRMRMCKRKAKKYNHKTFVYRRKASKIR